MPDKNILRQILIRVAISSPLLALLMITPIYIVNTATVQPFFDIWTKVFAAVLCCWGVQIFLLPSFKKRGFSKLSYIIFLFLLTFIILLFTNERALKIIPLFQEYSQERAILFRFCLAFSIQLVIYFILDLVYSQEEKIQLIKENTALQYNNLESQYKLLKAQVNPHFLFNALNISKSLIKNQPKNAEKYIVQLSEFLRRSINNQQKTITLQKELENCQQYIDLQKVRFENTFTYTVDVEEDALNKKLPFYALITLVENAFKHNSFAEEMPLNIIISTTNDFVVVKNNLKAKNGVVSTHTGLSNLNQRSKMLSDTEIKIENDGQFFSVKVKLIDL